MPAGENLMRWLPHGWAITTNNLPGLGKWQYEAFAHGLEPIYGPPPGHHYRSEREAKKYARQALRHRALNLMATGWTPSSGVAHGMIHGQFRAICNEKLELAAMPNLNGKESPKCSRCERILERLNKQFPDDEC